MMKLKPYEYDPSKFTTDDALENYYHCCEELKKANEKIKAFRELRNELREYADFVNRASRTHGVPNPERHKALIEILDKLEKILEDKVNE